MRADGRDQHQLTQHAGDFGAAWSPDGTLLAFTRWERSRNLRGYSVWVVRAEGADARRLTPDGRYEAAGWSPDGRFVVFTKDGGHFETNATVWVMRPDGTGKRRLAAGDMPSWSPDGRRIAFVRWSQTGERGVTTYVMNQDGTGVRRLFAGAAGSRWSPDSKRLAVSAQRGCNGAGVFVVDAATARARRLTNDCRITGTGLGERLRGTRERDVVQALGGDDTIDANPRDLPNVYAGRLDDDVVDGGAGADRVWGRRGVDVVRGGRGNDTIIGGRGADRLFGGPGDDLLVGGPYHDRLFGGPGADRLRGGAGNDRIFARDGSRDVVGCGHGRPDRVVADALDSVAADCELVSRR